MILVFTNGDQVDEITLKKMLSDKRATYLQVFIISVQCCFAMCPFVSFLFHALLFTEAGEAMCR